VAGLWRHAPLKRRLVHPCGESIDTTRGLVLEASSEAYENQTCRKPVVLLNIMRSPSKKKLIFLQAEQTMECSIAKSKKKPRSIGAFCALCGLEHL